MSSLDDLNKKNHEDISKEPIKRKAWECPSTQETLIDYYANLQKMDRDNAASQSQVSDTGDVSPLGNLSEKNQIQVVNSPQISKSDLPSKRDLAILISKLAGMQERFFYFVLSRCNTNEGFQTPPLQYVDIAETIQCGSNIRDIASKLVHKGLIQIVKTKSHPGFLQFSLTNDIQEVGTYFMARKKASDAEFKQFLAKTKKASKKKKNKYF